MAFFFFTAIFNFALEALFCYFVSSLEWCNVLPFLSFLLPLNKLWVNNSIPVGIRVLGVEHP